jgi:FkbM family methyltransferase
MKSLFLSIAAWTAKILPEPAIRVIYQIKPLARLIRRGLNRASPTGLTEVQVAAGDLAGYTIQLDMQVDKDYWLGTYEPELQSAVRKLIPEGATIYDIGANIGYVSLLLEKAAKNDGHIYAFEALPSNVAQLNRNVELNGKTEKITIIPAAVTNITGKAHFKVHPSGGMGKVAGSAGREDQYLDDIVVDAVSLDDFVFNQHNPPPQVIKMDIEGGEVLAFPGMYRVLREFHPLMLIELHGPDSSRIAWDTLKAMRYEIHWMKEDFSAVPSLEAMGWKAYIVARFG